ncbi:MAG: hypothetical protein Hals2KO_02380 [Halioglobus sp.]
MQALADYCECGWQRWPADASSTWAARRQYFGLMLATKRGRVRRFPQRDPLDEYPAVPYYRIDNGPWFFDSTGFAMHLDAIGQGNSTPLIPTEGALAFVAQLIDEAFDEFGLYLVHHMRWAGTWRTTTMPDVTAAEMRLLMPRFMRARLPDSLAARQSRRCPYLFSVAPQGFDLGIAQAQTPPSLPGFPETHSLLNGAWRSFLAAMEAVLAKQPFLLGDRFTLADASAYGQLSMNLIDGAPAELLRQLAPTTFDWLCSIRDGRHIGSKGALYLSEDLQPLLKIISDTFVPLMSQNCAAYERCIERGETLFNEAAFNQGRALYDGELLGYRYRAVVKDFQVRVWRDLLHAWGQLPREDADVVQDYLPAVCTAVLEGGV